MNSVLAVCWIKMQLFKKNEIRLQCCSPRLMLIHTSQWYLQIWWAILFPPYFSRCSQTPVCVFTWTHIRTNTSIQSNSFIKIYKQMVCWMYDFFSPTTLTRCVSLLGCVCIIYDVYVSEDGPTNACEFNTYFLLIFWIFLIQSSKIKGINGKQ